MKLVTSILMLLGMSGLVLAADKQPDPAKPATSPKTAQVAPSDPQTSAFPVIGYLEARGKTIIIKSGLKGPVYSVKNPQGKLLFENLSVEQLRAKAPEVHEFLKTAIAREGKGTEGSRVDAGLRVGAIR
jgi:hypothetical protein